MSQISKLSPQAIKLLKDAESFSEKFNAIEEKGDTIRLWMSFWSWEEIQEAEEIKNDWGLSEGYHPLYGDWHDVFCIYRNGINESVVALNDDREVQATWSSLEKFVSALKYVQDEPDESSGVDEKESWLSF